MGGEVIPPKTKNPFPSPTRIFPIPMPNNRFYITYLKGYIKDGIMCDTLDYTPHSIPLHPPLLTKLQY